MLLRQLPGPTERAAVHGEGGGDEILGALSGEDLGGGKGVEQLGEPVVDVLAGRELHQQILGSGSPTSMSIMRCPPKDVRPSTRPGGSVTTSPMSTRVAVRPRSTASPQGHRRRPRRRRTRRACLRWPRTADRCPSSSPAPATAGRDGQRGLVDDDADAARRPRSRRQRWRLLHGWHHACSADRDHTRTTSASTTGHSAMVSLRDVGLDLEVAAGEQHRHAVVADRARDEHPVAGPHPVRADVDSRRRARRRRWW